MIDIKSNYKIKEVSNTRFGFFLLIISILINTYFFFFVGHIIFWIFLLSILLILFNIFIPKIYYWPKRLWIKLGNIVGIFGSFIILLFIYYFIFVPVGIFLRIFKIDLMNVKDYGVKDTYWKDHEKLNNSLKDQF